MRSRRVNNTPKAYIVTYHSGDSEPVRYCDECASLARRDWNGDTLALRCAPDLLQIVMVNLLSNAVKYGNEGGEVRLSVRKEGERLVTSVHQVSYSRVSFAMTSGCFAATFVTCPGSF